ncbi:thiamine-phosphate kinase, partial [bacterium]|nr:thiamine-phosphate kinase [bacterium]
DGLARDAAKLARASGARAVILEEALVSPVLARAARTLGAVDLIELALEGGEDYELLVAAGPAFERSGVARSFRRVGFFEKGRGLSLRKTDGSTREIGERGFSHRG